MLSAEMRADIWQKERTEQRKKDARHLHIAVGNCLKRRKTKGISLHSDHDVVFQRRNKHSCCTFSNLKRASPGGPIRVESIKYETNRRSDSQASTQWDTVARSMCYIVYTIYILCISCVLCKYADQYFTPAPADSPTDAIHLHAMQILLIKKLSQCHNQSNCLNWSYQCNYTWVHITRSTYQCALTLCLSTC